MNKRTRGKKMLTEKDIVTALAGISFTNKAVPILKQFLGKKYDPSERTYFSYGEIPTNAIEITLSDNRIIEINYSSGMSWTAKGGRSWTKVN